MTTSISGGNIAVPARYWKVLVVLPFGEDDLTRINSATRVIAVDMPNTQSANALEWYDYRASVDAIEAQQRTGCAERAGYRTKGYWKWGWMRGR